MPDENDDDGDDASPFMSWCVCCDMWSVAQFKGTSKHEQYKSTICGHMDITNDQQTNVPHIESDCLYYCRICLMFDLDIG